MSSDKNLRLPRITIITSTLNCATAFDATAASINSQTFSNIQWIVADGGSTDGTVERIQQAGVSNSFSGPDSGIYDAWNKACQLIEGEWVLFLGAGDLLLSTVALEKVALALAGLPRSVLVAYGNVIQGKPGEQGRRHGKVELTSWDLYRPALPAHQGVFVRAGQFKGLRPFDSSYRVAADSKFLLQFIKDNTTRHLDIDVTLWVPGGISEHPKSTLKVMREFLRLEREMGYQIPLARKMLFVSRSYARALAYRTFGESTVEFVARAKRRLETRFSR